jgi:hypothetical protein
VDYSRVALLPRSSSESVEYDEDARVIEMPRWRRT